LSLYYILANLREKSSFETLLGDCVSFLKVYRIKWDIWDSPLDVLRICLILEPKPGKMLHYGKGVTF
jgi:hypothetical protein